MKSLELLLIIMNIFLITSLKSNKMANAEIILIYTEDDFDACIIDSDECTMLIDADITLSNEKNITSKTVTIYMSEHSISYQGDNETNETNYMFDIKDSNFTIILNSESQQYISIDSTENKTAIFNVQNSYFTIKENSSDNFAYLTIGNKYVESSLVLSDGSTASIQGNTYLNGTKNAIEVVNSTISFNDLSNEKTVYIFGDYGGNGILSTSSEIIINENVEIRGNVGIELYDTKLEINGKNDSDKTIYIGSKYFYTTTAIKFSKKNNISIKGKVEFYGKSQVFLYENSLEEQLSDAESQISFEVNKNIVLYSSSYQTTFQFDNDDDENTLIYFNKEKEQTSYTNLTSMEIFGENSNISYDFQIANSLFADHQVISEDTNQFDTFTNSNGKTFLKILNNGTDITSKITIFSLDSIENTEFFQMTKIYPEQIFNLNNNTVVFTYNRALINVQAFKISSDTKTVTIESGITKSDNSYEVIFDFSTIDIYGEVNVTAVLGDSQYEICDSEYTLKINRINSISLDDVTYEETDKNDILIPKNEDVEKITLVSDYDISEMTISEILANDINLDNYTAISSSSLVITINEKIPEITEDLTFYIKFSYYNLEYEYSFNVKCLQLNSLTPSILFLKGTSNIITLKYNHQISNIKSFEIIKKDQEEALLTITDYYYDEKASSDSNYVYVLTATNQDDFLGEFYVKINYYYDTNTFAYSSKDITFTVYTVLEIESLSINNKTDFGKESYQNILLTKANDLSQIFITLNDQIEKNRLSIENTFNYEFTYSIQDDNDHIIVIDTSNKIGSNYEDSITISLIDELDKENKMSFTINLLELKKITPNSIELVKNKETFGEISLLYNMELVNCSEIQLIQYNEAKEEVIKKTIAFENITQEEDNSYSFNITYDDNLNGSFYVKTMFNNDYLNFVNTTLSLEIKINENEDEPRKTSVAALIVVICVVVCVVLAVVIVLFIKRSGKQAEFDKINKTSFIESSKQLEDKEDRENNRDNGDNDLI